MSFVFALLVDMLWAVWVSRCQD